MKTSSKLKLIPILLFIAMFSPNMVKALDFSFQPSLQVGAMYYNFEQDPASFASSFITFTRDKLEYSDVMPTVSGGLAVSVDNFVINIYGQKAFDGSDNDTFSQGFATFFDQGLAFNHFQKVRSDADFDREEYGIYVGYNFLENRNARIYAGYKKAKTEFDIDQDIDDVFTFVGFAAPGITEVFAGPATFSFDSEFEQEGPFVGIAYNWDISKGFLNGKLVADFAIAFLDADFDQSIRGFTPRPGEDPPIEFASTTEDIDGDTIGGRLALTWVGLTKIDGLNYTIGVDGYQYNFDVDSDVAGRNVNGSDIQEIVVNVKAGLVYVF